MSLHSSLRTLHDVLIPVVPSHLMRWLEEKYLLTCGEQEIHLLSFLCQADRDALDVGGNEGCFSIFLRKYAREVLTFEPVPHLADELIRKFGHAIDVRCLALSASTGRAVLHIPEVGGKLITALSSLSITPSMRHARIRDIVVETAPLDDIYHGDVGFIKIDVEGHEEAVLQGAQATIALNRPRMLIEIEERHAPGALSRITTFLGRQDYQCYFLHHGLVQPLSQFDPLSMQSEERLLCYGAYINNFIFLPGEEADELVQAMNARSPHAELRLHRNIPAQHAPLQPARAGYDQQQMPHDQALVQ
ncbi:MAG TPA: FkbM family methyltransferase [Acetobacteraceae bacterium]